MATTEAGCNLDRQIAERVMGWTLGTLGDDTTYLDADGSPICSPYDFEPSRLLDDAWKVVAHFRFFDLSGDSIGTKAEKWRASVTTRDGTMHYGKGETAPLAICRAALRSTT